MSNVAGGSVAINHKAEILHRMAAGEPITKIAQSLGYKDHVGIIARLGDDPDYHEALKAGVYGRLERREQELEIADNNVTVSRADRLLNHARWWAERLDPARWAGRVDITSKGNEIKSLTGASEEIAMIARGLAFILESARREEKTIEGESVAIEEKNEENSMKSVEHDLPTVK